MDMKKIAKEALRIMEQGYYEVDGRRVEIGRQQASAVEDSILLTPDQGEALLADLEKGRDGAGGFGRQTDRAAFTVKNCGTVQAILELAAEGKAPGVLNFASAKNPGGGFMNGAVAQEETLAASGCLYRTQIAHREYYESNRACGTMMYTNYAIFSPDVVFFRDGRTRLLEEPVTASVLTLPAVNMGQVLLKGEDVAEAERVMKRRMKLSLAIFSRQGCRDLVLGAYGCGVFRNDPVKIAGWWKELLKEWFPAAFDTVVFAVLDRSGTGKCLQAFERTFS